MFGDYLVIILLMDFACYLFFIVKKKSYKLPKTCFGTSYAALIGYRYYNSGFKYILLKISLNYVPYKTVY